MRKTHFYKGYAIHKPEGTTAWNVHEIINNQIDWCFSLAFCQNLKEARITIDSMISEKEEVIQ